MEPRPTQSRGELKAWLENMIWYHHYSDEEIAAVFGMPLPEVSRLRGEFGIDYTNRPERQRDAPIHVLPYPGGRHPRIQFLEGAINPQRETKVSVFAPWDPTSYAVADVPEAIWSNLGLTYLAHVHVPTIWSQRGVELKSQEWQRRESGVLEMERRLPNGIVFGTRVTPQRDRLRMEQWLTNGTPERLTDLRVQNCLMLKGLSGFEQLTNENKVFQPPYVACHDAEKKRWIITAWDPCHRAWGNPPCPCLHSDPKYPDCAPGETQRLRGGLWFYEGADLQTELKRIDMTDWREA
ncbi:MAG: hypothetical protein ACK47B_17685 [Armatimonadota bacterium]